MLQQYRSEVGFVVQNELLTREEAADILKVSLTQLYRLTRDGEIAVVKRGRRFVRYQRSDIEDFINRHLYRGAHREGGA